MTVGGNTVKLVLDTSMSTNVRIDHDGAFNFAFYGVNELRRAALFTSDYQIIEHYAFPSISGGKVMTVTPPGAAAKPGGAPPATSIGTVTVSGNATPSDPSTETYSVGISGDAGNLTYAWTVDQSGTISGSSTGATVSVDWAGTDVSTLTCSVTSGDAGVTDSPKPGQLSVTPA